MSKVIRAKMSDHEERDSFIWCFGRNSAIPRAKREACAILAETETTEANLAYNRGLGHGYWSAFEIGEQYPNSSPWSDAGCALAESLAAFISHDSF